MIANVLIAWYNHSQDEVILLKNLRVYAVGTTIVLISGMVGFASGMRNAKDLGKEAIVEETMEQDPISQTKSSIDSDSIISNSSSIVSNSQEDRSIDIEGEQLETGTGQDCGLEFQHFKEEKDSLKEEIMTGDISSVIELGKNNIRLGKDFIYNGAEIRGITFDQLTEQGRKETLDNLAIIDTWMMAIDPEYKSQIEKGVDTTKGIFGKAKEKVKIWISSLGDDK